MPTGRSATRTAPRGGSGARPSVVPTTSRATTAARTSAPIPVTKEYRRSDSSPVPKRIVSSFSTRRNPAGATCRYSSGRVSSSTGPRARMLFAMASSSSQSDGLAKYCHARSADAECDRRHRGASRMSMRRSLSAESLGRRQRMERHALARARSPGDWPEGWQARYSPTRGFSSIGGACDDSLWPVWARHPRTTGADDRAARCQPADRTLARPA